MLSLFDRLRSGRRWWPDELVLRFTGLGLLAGCRHFAQLAHRSLATPPHQPTLAEFGMCTVLFALLSAGLALAIEGAGLFRLVPIPRPSIFSRSGPLQMSDGPWPAILALDRRQVPGANSGQ